MVTTRYGPGNIALLLAEIVVALSDGWVSVMTMAFGSDPVRNLKTGACMAVLWVSLALIPASLITLRWPRVGAIVSWSVVALCLLSVWASPLVLLFLTLATVEGLIATKIASRSEGAFSLTVIPH